MKNFTPEAKLTEANFAKYLLKSFTKKQKGTKFDTNSVISDGIDKLSEI